MLPYYVIDGTKEGEDEEFFFSHKGFYNFWNEYLLLNLGYHNHFVLVNRTGRKFSGEYVKEEIEQFKSVIEEHIEAHSPEKMFADFPDIYAEYKNIIVELLKIERW